MKNISEALILAVQYLATDRNEEEYTEDDDLKIVEAAADLVQNATDEEKEMLIKVSKELGLVDWARQIGIE